MQKDIDFWSFALVHGSVGQDLMLEHKFIGRLSIVKPPSWNACKITRLKTQDPCSPFIEDLVFRKLSRFFMEKKREKKKWTPTWSLGAGSCSITQSLTGPHLSGGEFCGGFLLGV